MESGTPMITEIFTRDLVQAVSDWQRGGSHDQKVKRGERLYIFYGNLYIILSFYFDWHYLGNLK